MRKAHKYFIIVSLALLIISLLVLVYGGSWSSGDLEYHTRSMDK